MIVCCPACQARIRIDRQRLAGKRISLRCVRCREIFKAEIPANFVASSRIQVLVAHADKLLCTTIRDLLAGEAIDCRIASEGETAFQMMECQPPQVAILDVAISGAYIFELVEKIKKIGLSAERRSFSCPPFTAKPPTNERQVPFMVLTTILKNTISPTICCRKSIS